MLYLTVSSITRVIRSALKLQVKSKQREGAVVSGLVYSQCQLQRIAKVVSALSNCTDG